jgi:hypothetical protein
VKTTFLGSSLFVLAACGGKPSSTITPTDKVPDHTSGGGPAYAGPAYAGLFAQGATWSVEVTTTHGSEGGDQTAFKPVTVTCEVGHYTEAKGITSIEITCGDGWPRAVGGDPLTGAWAMSDKGVWRIAAFPGNGVAPALDDHDPLIAAPPVAGVIRDMPTDGPSSITLEQKGDAWCHSMMINSITDQSWAAMCVDPDGPTEGKWGSDNGIYQGAEFTRVR